MNRNLPSRRELLSRTAGGFGAVALASLLADGSLADGNRADTGSPAQAGAIKPRAKRVIQLFMNGGPFQADLLDPKPLINKFAGQRPDAVNLRTERPTAGLMAVPFAFQKCGKSGLEVSELLPGIGSCIDDICVMRSMHTDNPNHGPALFLMNNGTMVPTRPSMGSWLSYGLGTENADLPTYVVLCPGRPVRFAELWSSGFLPGEHQGTYINHSDPDPARMLPNLKGVAPIDVQRKRLDLIQNLNRDHEAERGADRALEARIRSLETAYRMQAKAAEAFDIAKEPAKVRAEYGKGKFADGCLLARRLAERGVRFTQVYYGDGQPWDSHSKHNETSKRLAADIDKPITALLTDLKRLGLLEDTLVIWGGEFGRTSTSEAGNGRDHNHWGFTMFLAGGGARGGTAYGATDDFGFRAVENKVHIHDLHATVLHLLGIDHEKLTYRHSGRDFRLTDVYGNVVSGVLAG